MMEQRFVSDGFNWCEQFNQWRITVQTKNNSSEVFVGAFLRKLRTAGIIIIL